MPGEERFRMRKTHPPAGSMARMGALPGAKAKKKLIDTPAD